MLASPSAGSPDSGVEGLVDRERGGGVAILVIESNLSEVRVNCLAESPLSTDRPQRPRLFPGRGPVDDRMAAVLERAAPRNPAGHPRRNGRMDSYPWGDRGHVVRLVATADRIGVGGERLVREATLDGRSKQCAQPMCGGASRRYGVGRGNYTSRGLQRDSPRSMSLPLIDDDCGAACTQSTRKNESTCADFV